MPKCNQLKHCQGVQHTTNSKRAASQGFTLIELLVVIAIIAILAAILFPVFGRARENGRRSSCMSNMKQILLGVAQYGQDFDEKQPMLLVNTAAAAPNQVTWTQLIQPYTKSIQIFTCPSDDFKPTATNTGIPNVRLDPTSAGYVRPFHTSYIASAAVFGTGPQGLPKIISPSTVIGISDGGLQAIDTAPYINPEVSKPRSFILEPPSSDSYPSRSTTVLSSNGSWAAPNPRHLETAVVGYMDGHVKALRIEKFYRPQVGSAFASPPNFQSGCMMPENDKPCG